MRPPMGAGSHHQAKPAGNSMGFIMPLYTIGIVAFFVYTIMRLVCKKTPTPTPQFTPAKNGKVEMVENKEEVETFITRPDDGRTKLGKRILTYLCNYRSSSYFSQIFSLFLFRILLTITYMVHGSINPTFFNPFYK